MRPVLPPDAVAFHDEFGSQEVDAFLAERIHAFNVQATGYADGRLLAASLRDAAGEIIAGVSGHTLGGCCEIAHVWVHERHRGQGLGRVLVDAAEAEARRRGCEQVVLTTHSFQAPGFYERLGYVRAYAIEGRPKGHANLVYVKRLAAE
jgi:GNAT superfamily N-acetyltransferase